MYAEEPTKRSLKTVFHAECVKLQKMSAWCRGHQLLFRDAKPISIPPMYRVA